MLQNILDDMEGLESRIRVIAPMGYALAVNIRGFTPEFYLTTYPEDWVKIYHERRYALFDPVTIWSRFHEGAVRWSEIAMPAVLKAGNHVLEHARRYDLVHGGGVSARAIAGAHARSILFGARQDREMTDDELAELAEILEVVMTAVGQHAGLSESELDALRSLAAGLTHNEIADQGRVSPSTIKKRIERAREVLGARNAVHAVAIATKRGLILSDPTI